MKSKIFKKILTHPALHLIHFIVLILMLRVTLEERIDKLVLVCINFFVVVSDQVLYVTIKRDNLKLNNFISQRMEIINGLACYALMLGQVYIIFIK